MSGPRQQPLPAEDAATELLGAEGRLAAARRVRAAAGTAEVFNGLVGLACRLLGAASGQVSVLADEQYVAGGAGTASSTVGSTVPLTDSLCALTAADRRPLAMADAREEPRARGLGPVVSGMVRSYLGVPVADQQGQVVGSLCVFDAEPRRWTSDDVGALQLIGRAVGTELAMSAVLLEHEAERLRWTRSVDAGEVGSFDWDLASDRMTWDARMQELFGYVDHDYDGSVGAFLGRLHPDDVDGVRQRVADALATCGSCETEYRIRLPDGRPRWVKARGKALCDDTGRAVRLVGAAYDTTGTHEDRPRTGRTLEAMPSGFVSLDPGWRYTVLNAAAERLLGRDRSQLLGRTIWEAFPELAGSQVEAAYRTAVATQTPQTLEAWYPAPLDEWFEILAWPTPDGLSLYFTDVSERRAAAERAERDAARQALLARVNTEMMAAADVPAAVSGLADLLVPTLADRCAVSLPGAESRLSPGQPPDRDAGAGLVLPIRGRDRVLGTLSLSWDDGRVCEPGDEAIARDVASRAGMALDNARLARAQSQLAEGLQRNLLTAPPEPDHAHIVVRYVPASESARVGGDWYDAFMQPSGATMLVIGDVVGHDVEAAAAMAQLRSLLRGIATYSNGGPAAVLNGLDSSMQLLQVSTMATAAIVRLEQTAREYALGLTRVRWANAGHPPPLVVHPDGRQEFLTDGRADLLLGVDPTARRAEHVVTLQRDTTVLLYTDGLVERRSSDLDAGLDRLQAVVRELAGAGLDELCDGLVARLVAGRPEDDVALVAVRLHRQDRPRPPEAGPRMVPPQFEPTPGG